nr:transposase family protein [Streptomyces canus]
MPAAPFFPIPVVLGKLAPHQHDTGRLRAHLQRVPDPRSRRGRWYPVLGLLLICACAVVSGARTITEITEWGQRASNGVLEELGIRRHLPGRRRAPSKATLTRLLAALDGRTSNSSGHARERERGPLLGFGNRVRRGHSRMPRWALWFGSAPTGGTAVISRGDPHMTIGPVGRVRTRRGLAAVTGALIPSGPSGRPAR